MDFVNNNQILCPFGRILLSYQDAKLRLNNAIYIHVGKDAKAYATADIEAMALASYIPNIDDLSRYTWPISNQHVVVMAHGDISESSLKTIGLYLLKFKPRIIYTWSNHLCLFFKGENNGQ
jgi:hypothetical protein